MISVIVNTCNEEKYIRNCLQSLSWADEIVVVDMYSSDQSVQIAKEFTDKIYFHQRAISVLYARNFAVSKAKGDWILVVDPDEIVPQALADTLREIERSNPAYNGVSLPVRMFFFSKKLMYAYPVVDKVRFFRKGKADFPARVHTQPVVEGNTYKLPHEEQNMLKHYTTDSVGQFMEKTRRYTTDESRHKFSDDHLRVSLFQVAKKPVAEFYNIIFSRRGYRDGWAGFAYALLMSWYRFELYRKLWLLKYQKLKNSEPKTAAQQAQVAVGTQIAVVTIFFKETREMLEHFLRSVYRCAGDISLEVLIVNNSGQDISFLRNEFSGVTVLNNPGNTGVASTRNQAFDHVGSGIILMLDCDMDLGPDTIKVLYAYLSNHPQVDAVTPKLIYPDGAIQRNNFGRLPSLFFPFREMFLLPFYDKKEIILQKSDFIGGGCMMIRKPSWDKVGKYDERFSPYGWEDADWCLRAKEIGLQLYYLPDAQITHFVHKSAQESGARQVEFYLSEIYYYRKHTGWFYAVFIAFVIVSFSLSRILFTFLAKDKAESRKRMLTLIRKIVFERVPFK